MQVLCFKALSIALYILEIKTNRRRQAKAVGSELAEPGISLVTCVWQRLRVQAEAWVGSQ